MLHIATVHFKSPRWIDIQARYLRENISVPYKTWTSLQFIDPSYGRYFDHVVPQLGSHAEKLNHLAREISVEASEEDLLMFLDGDAFPVVDPMPLITESLQRAPLLAVRRAENLNEPQPHPCFCVTTVGTWLRIRGDWGRGPTWPEVDGAPVSDVGAHLMRALELTGNPWTEMLRSNGQRLHALFFAIYGDTVYHHGGGFRGVVTRLDRASGKTRHSVNDIPGVARLRKRATGRGQREWADEVERRNRERSEYVYGKIAAGGYEWLSELDWPGAAAAISAKRSSPTTAEEKASAAAEGR